MIPLRSLLVPRPSDLPRPDDEIAGARCRRIGCYGAETGLAACSIEMCAADITRRNPELGRYQEVGSALRSQRRAPAIDADYLAGDPVRILRDQECREVAGIVGFAEPAERVGLRDCAGHLLV